MRRQLPAAPRAWRGYGLADPSQLVAAALEAFAACVAAHPTCPLTAFLGREEGELAARENEPVRIALVADGIGGMHGVTHTIDEIRERGVPGFEVEVIGTDPHVDRRLGAVAEVELPFYPELKDWGSEPFRPSSRRWPRAATTCCTSARPDRRVSPRR